MCVRESIKTFISSVCLCLSLSLSLSLSVCLSLSLSLSLSLTLSLSLSDTHTHTDRGCYVEVSRVTATGSIQWLSVLTMP